MNTLSIKLLLEIAKLWRKYGKKTFSDLSQLLSQDNFSEEVTNLLNGYMNAINKQKKTKHKTTLEKNVDNTILSEIRAMRNSQPEKAGLLLRLYEQLTNKEILPTMRDIRTYSEFAHFPTSKARSRDKAIQSMYKIFTNMSMNELNWHLNNLPKTVNNYQRSLSQWSNIISRKNINENEQRKMND